MDSIRSIMKQVVSGYKDDKPPHVVPRGLSVFHTLTQEAYDKKSVREVHEILCTQHIVIVDQGHRAKFDANGLRTLARLNEPIPIQGVSFFFSFFHQQVVHSSYNDKINPSLSTKMVMGMIA